MQNNKLNQKSKALPQKVWRRRAKPTKKICRTALIENRFCTSAQAADSVTTIAAGKQDEQATKKNVQIMITHAFGRVLSVLAIVLSAAISLLSAHATELISNASFETTVPSMAPWYTQNSTAGWWNFNNSAGAHTGNRYEYIGVASDGVTTANNVEDVLFQDVAIPSGTTSSALTFWLKITTADTSGIAHDTLALEVRNTGNTVLQTLANYSNANVNNAWVQQSFTITGYAGQTIRIAFHGKTDASIQTVFRIDDVSLQPTVSANYTITVSASPSAGGTVGGGGTFTSGSSRTVAATANSGYTFADWTENSSVVSYSSSYNFTLNANRNLVANFAATSTTVELSGVPYIHQLYDTADGFTAGNDCCNATAALMAIQYYGKLPANPITCSRGGSHISNYGFYISSIYSYNGHTYNIPSSGAWDTWDIGFYGGFGYFLQDNPGSPLQRSTRLSEYISYHGLTSGVDAASSSESDFTKICAEINAGHPVVVFSATITPAGHYITCIGYVIGQHTLIFNDSYGSKQSGYPNKNGARVFYDWPGYNNGYANVSSVDRLIYARGEVTDMTAPTISAFSVTPTTVTLGQCFSMSYTVSDSGGSGLKLVVFRRTSGNGSQNDLGWHDIQTATVSGNGPVSGSFSDSPTSVGTYWYGMGVYDNANNGQDERGAGLGPVQRTVTTPVSTINSVTPVPASGANATVGQSFALAVNVSYSFVAAGYLQVWVYDNGFVTSVMNGVANSGPQAGTVQVNLDLPSNAAGQHNYTIYTQFRPGTTSGPLLNDGINDVIQSSSYSLNWQNPTYTIAVSASPSAGGTVGGGGTFVSGSSQTVTATANSGYTFANWTEGGSVVSSSASYTFTLNGNRTLVANFTANPVNYTIAVSASPSAGGTVGGGGTFVSGSSQTVTATANSGYTFANWTEGGSVVSSSANYTFTLYANRTLVANFTVTPVNYTIAVSAAPSAGGTVSGGGTFTSGSSCTAIATANPGFIFINWTENANPVSSSSNYSFTLNGNRVLVANFVAMGGTTNIVFSDNFNDNAIDTNKWTTSGNTVSEASQTMQVLTTVTDQGGVLVSTPVPINPHGDITITRRAFLHYGNQYFAAQMNVKFGNLGWAGVRYANYFWAGNPSYGWKDRYGIYVSRNDAYFINQSSDTNLAGPFTPIWDTWFTEKLVYSPDTGNLQYFTNNTKVADFFIGVMPPTNTPTLQFQFTAWGWYTGHQQLFDDLQVTQTSVPAAQVRLNGLSMSNRVVRFVLNGPIGTNCVVQVSTNLVNWSPLSTNTVSSGGWVIITDFASTNMSRRFYRSMIP